MMDEFTLRFRAAIERYTSRFPGELPDMRSMSDREYYALPDLMDRAILRGGPITDADFVGGVVGPDPELGRVL
jgi:hypothetical protein